MPPLCHVNGTERGEAPSPETLNIPSLCVTLSFWCVGCFLYLWSNTPAQGPCRRTWTSRWPGHLGGSRRCCSHSGGSPRRTESCCAPARERSPECSQTLRRDDRTGGYTLAFRNMCVCVCEELILHMGQKAAGYRGRGGEITRCQNSRRVSSGWYNAPDSFCPAWCLLSKWQNQKNRWQTQRQEMAECETSNQPLKSWNETCWVKLRRCGGHVGDSLK